MHKVERYGVIALVFLVVSVVVVSLWEEEPAVAEPADTDAALVDAARRPDPSATRPATPAGIASPAAVPAGSGPRRPELSTASPGYASAAPATDRPHSRPVGGPSGPVPTPGGAAAHAAERGPVSPPPAATPSTARPSPGARPVAQGSAEPVRERPTPERAQPVTRTAPPRESARPVAAASRPARPAASTPRTVSDALAPGRGAAAGTYTVAPGDTLSVISQRALGTARRWREIRDLNGVDPERLIVGQVLKLPAPEPGAGAASSADARGAVAPPPGRAYVVRAGDVLSIVAQRELGASARWTEIRALNPGLDPERLHVGARLVMPSDWDGTPAPRETAERFVSAGAARPAPTRRADADRPRVR